jgi:hypothetical protein
MGQEEEQRKRRHRRVASPRKGIGSRRSSPLVQANQWQELASTLGDAGRQEKFLKLMGAKGQEAVPLTFDATGGDGAAVRACAW